MVMGLARIFRLEGMLEVELIGRIVKEILDADFGIWEEVRQEIEEGKVCLEGVGVFIEFGMGNVELYRFGELGETWEF